MPRLAKGSFISLVLCLASLAVAAAPIPASDGLYKPTFLTKHDSWFAGTAFLVRVPGRAEPLLVTPHHLFGPAAGLDKQMTSDEIAAQVRGAVGVSMQDGKSLVLAPTYLKVTNARALGQQGCEKDLALFAVRGGTQLHVFELAPSMPRIGEKVYMFARLHGSEEPKLYPATVTEVTPKWLAYVFDDASLELNGTSGAPVLDSSGHVVAMNVGGGPSEGTLLGTGNPASAIRREIASTPK